jgi:hypothetical protein
MSLININEEELCAAGLRSIFHVPEAIGKTNSADGTIVGLVKYCFLEGYKLFHFKVVYQVLTMKWERKG